MGYNNCNIRYLLNTYYSFYCSSSINHFKQLQMKQEIYQSGFYFMLGLIIGAAITFSKPKVEAIPVQIELVKDSTIKVKPKLTEKTLRSELSKHNIPHPEIVLAQAKLESNYFKSDLVKSHQNIFRMKKGNKYRRYSHWTECVADYKKRISSRYTGGDYYSFLLRIKYAEDPNYIETLKQLV